MIGTVAAHELYHGVTGISDDMHASPESPTYLMGVDSMSLSDGISGLNSNQFTFTYGEANDLLSDCTRAPLMVFNDFSGADATDNSSVARSTEYKEAPAALTSEVNMDGQTKDECVSVELLSAMKEVATEHID